MWPPVAAMSLLLDADDLPAECLNNSWITFVSCDVIFPPSPMAPTRRTLHLISHITSNKIFLVTPSVAFSSSNHSKECREKCVFCCKTRISSLINHIKINTGRFYFDYWHRLFHFRTVSFKLDVCWNSHLHKYFFFLYWLPSCWRGAIIYSSKYSRMSLVTCTLLLNLANHPFRTSFDYKCDNGSCLCPVVWNVCFNCGLDDRLCFYPSLFSTSITNNSFLTSSH